MKKLFCAITILSLVAGSAFAADTKTTTKPAASTSTTTKPAAKTTTTAKPAAKTTSPAKATPAKSKTAAKAKKGLDAIYDAGTIAFNVGLGYTEGYQRMEDNTWDSYGTGFGILAGGEYDFVKFDIADMFTLSVGADARVLLGFLDMWYYTQGGAAFGIGAQAIAHLGFSGLAKQNNLDWLNKFDFYIALGLAANPLCVNYVIGLANTEGVSYFFADNMGVNIEYTYLNSSYIGAVQFIYKL